MSISDRMDEIEDDIHNAFRLPKTPAVALVAEEWAPDMLAALRAVLDLHKPRNGHDDCGHCVDPADAHWGIPWPCPTVRAVQAALGEVQQ